MLAGPPSSQPSDGVVIAVIGSIGLAVAAIVPALIAGRARSAPQPPPPEPRDRVLERFLYRVGFDPARIVTGEEPTDDVRLTP